MASQHQRLNLLLVQDNPNRATMVRNELVASKIKCLLHTVGSGRNALNYLQHRRPFEAAPTPDLVLFDFVDPEPRVLKIMDQIKADESLHDIPVVLLTSHDSEQMLDNAYHDSDDCIMFSPIELDDFFRSMQSFDTERFLRAVKVIENLGFVLVRVPAMFMQQQDNMNRSIALSAGQRRPQIAGNS